MPHQARPGQAAPRQVTPPSFQGCRAARATRGSSMRFNSFAPNCHARASDRPSELQIQIQMEKEMQIQIEKEIEIEIHIETQIHIEIQIHI